MLNWSFNWNLTDFGIPRTFNIMVFAKENHVFSKNRLLRLASIYDAIWVPICLHFPSKIHQNSIKIKFQEAFKNSLILASIFDRFGLRFGSQVGAMLPTKTPPRRPRTPPRRAQAAPGRPKTPPRHPKRPQETPRRLQDQFLVDFWLNFDGFLIEF